MMKVLLTGADGFIGKNLLFHLKQMADIQVDIYTHQMALDNLQAKVMSADFIFHLAGVNRALDDAEFKSGNSVLTTSLCDCVIAAKRHIPIVFTSSIHVSSNNIYGVTKMLAEQALLNLHYEHENPLYIYRLPNVFGKWCKPNYNSVVATFCNNVANNLPLIVDNPAKPLTLVYIDDLVVEFSSLLSKKYDHELYKTVSSEYAITVGELADTLKSFKSVTNDAPIMADVGLGLIRALYATYLSYLPPDQFTQTLVKHSDQRGDFVEILKTTASGQFSYLTAKPGVSRGGHYHHTKNEKFLVVKGRAKFCFRNILSDEYYECIVSDDMPQIVSTIPGWAHMITNIGDDLLIVMLWANEVYDITKPDTYEYMVTASAARQS